MNWTLGINQWAMPGLDVRAASALAKRAGFEAIELNLDEDGELGLGASDADAQSLGRTVGDVGLRVGGLATGLYWRHSPTSDDVVTRRKASDIAKRQLTLAHALGAGAILVVPGGVGAPMGGPLVRYDVAYERAQEFVAALAPEAESAGVDLAVENMWNKLLLSPLEMRQFVDGAASERVGVYFDVGNVLLYGYPEHWIDILGPRIRRVHLKDFRRAVGTLDGFVDIGAGDVDWEAVGGALRRAGYDGPLTAEMFPTAQDRSDIEAYVMRIGQQVARAVQKMKRE